MENLQEKRLTVRPAPFAEVRELLAKAEAFDTSGGLANVDEWCRHAHCFAVISDQQVVGAYAIEMVTHWGGHEGVIVAAGGELPGGNLALSVLPDAEKRMKGCSSSKVETCRPGLAKLLVAQGYEFAGFVLRKKLC